MRFAPTVSLLVLVACGGAQPAQAPSGGSDPQAPTPSAPDAPRGSASDGESSQDEAAASPEDGSTNPNEFKTVDTHTAKDTHGVKPSNIKPTKTEAAVKFIVVDKDKGPVEGVVISLTSADGRKFYTQETDKTGYADVLLPVGQKYDITYLSLGSGDIEAKATVPEKQNLTMKLTLRYRGWVPSSNADAPRVVLDGVQFDTGKAKIRPESRSRLDTVVEYMTHKKNVRIEISGHTDNVGNKAANKSLSERRARACRDYLIEKGIDGSRIEAVGYGDERPIASNDTPEGRQKNRRIEATEL